MESRIDWNGKGAGHDGDKTTTGARCIGNYLGFTENGKMLLRVGDKTTVCPRCKQVGTIVSGDPTVVLDGKLAAVDGSIIACGCPYGTHRLIAPLVSSSINYYLSTTQPESVQEKPSNRPCACNRDITLDEFKQIAIHAPKDKINKYLAAINNGFSKFKIYTCREKAHFLAQVCGETGAFRKMKEDNGENRAYAPWYGRGILQLTQDYNYIDYGNYDHINAVENPDMILELPYCISSGFWVYCIQLNLIEYAKKDDFNYLVAKINGGFNGYIDRLNYFNHIVKILKADHLKSEIHNEFSFKRSEIYQYRLYSLSWGKWHDPNLRQYRGTEKDAKKALYGYYRAKELYEHRNDKNKVHEIEEKIKNLI